MTPSAKENELSEIETDALLMFYVENMRIIGEALGNPFKGDKSKTARDLAELAAAKIRAASTSEAAGRGDELGRTVSDFEIPDELVDKPWAWDMYFKLKAKDVEMNTHRRADILQMIPAELAIRNAVLEVEKLGADVRLTDIVVALSEQQSKLADWCEATGNVRPIAPSGEQGQPDEPLKCSDCILVKGKSICTMNCGPVLEEDDPLGIKAAQRIARGHAKLTQELLSHPPAVSEAGQGVPEGEKNNE